MSIPTVYGYDLVQEIGTWTPAASQIDTYDEDGVAYWEFWDASSTGAWIWTNGAFQSAQTVVAATNLDAVWFGGASDFTEEALWYRAIDTFGNASTWDYFLIDQTTDDFTAPSLSVYDTTQFGGEWTPASWSIYAQDLSGISAFQLWDSSSAGAWIWANGGYQSPQTEITVTSLDYVWFGGATDAASETIFVRAGDSANNWTDWTYFYVNQDFGSFAGDVPVELAGVQQQPSYDGLVA